jgi:hypothetical protein
MFKTKFEYRKGLGKKHLNSTEKRIRQLCDELDIRLPINLDETNTSQAKVYILGT